MFNDEGKTMNIQGRRSKAEYPMMKGRSFELQERRERDE
jgi:hypothetical protein